MHDTPSTTGTPKLRRVLGVWTLTLYGLGTIIGAGIYVLVGAVAADAGMAAPLSFVLAGVLAAFTGLSYAELSQRFPEAAGEAAYAKEAFNSDLLGRLLGLGTIAVAMVACATIARGASGYVLTLVDVPVEIPTALIIIGFTALAALGLRESIFLAVSMTLIEIGGLLFVVYSGLDGLSDLPVRWHEMIPTTANLWSGVMGGAFLAFFAFAGFENMVNMAEETRRVERTLPQSVVLAILASTVLYILVVLVAVLNVAPEQLAQSRSPLCLVVGCDQAGGIWFTGVALLATSNGVLLEIMLMARVTYGMARRGWLPKALADVHPRRRTPSKATVLVGLVALVLAVLFPFEVLAKATSALLLVIFVSVNLSLIALKMKSPDARLKYRVSVVIPILGAVTSLGLLIGELAF